jgi:hypothetical protein
MPAALQDFHVRSLSPRNPIFERSSYLLRVFKTYSIERAFLMTRCILRNIDLDRITDTLKPSHFSPQRAVITQLKDGLWPPLSTTVFTAVKQSEGLACLYSSERRACRTASASGRALRLPVTPPTNKNRNATDTLANIRLRDRFVFVSFGTDAARFRSCFCQARAGFSDRSFRCGPRQA